MPRLFLRDRLLELGFLAVSDSPDGWFRYEPSERTGLRALYFVGCGSNFQAPGEVVGALRLLQAGGCAITVAPNVCCGLPPYSYGDREGARLLAERNVGILTEGEWDVIVTECGSCSSFLKQYPRLLGANNEGEAAAALSSKVRDITEVLPELPLPEPRELRYRVTYHDPCHLGRKQSIREAPRQMLQRIPGVEYVELPEADWCCGGAGSFNLTNPELSRMILKRKIENVRETRAEMLLTSCPACVIQLSSGVREVGLRVQVEHLCEFLARAHVPDEMQGGRWAEMRGKRAYRADAANRSVFF